MDSDRDQRERNWIGVAIAVVMGCLTIGVRGWIVVAIVIFAGFVLLLGSGVLNGN